MGIQSLLQTMRDYLPDADLSPVEKAYAFAETAHDGQTRKSGEPYVQHPLNVALILAKMQLDSEVVCAALLHDVIEDTPTTLDDLRKRFGPNIAKLVDGVTKLSKIRWSSPEEQARKEKDAKAENLRKMFLAMAEDVRVVLIKLADRLHNMRTISALAPAKQREIAQQTLEIYAPLANRLGISQVRRELEDLSFQVLQPEKYRQVASLLAQRAGIRQRYLTRVQRELQKALSEAGIEAEISGRQKHIYSIYRKMERKERSFDRIYDVLAVRILVDEVKDCYGALGVIHTLWHPIPGEFDDYVAMPKENMYQSLHTAVVAVDGQPLEIQIRTREMHEIAENGIASHWRYKEGRKRDSALDEKIAWLRRLLEWKDELADAQDFVESLKSDVFQDQVYVFTPRGDIIDLPAGATPVDFAYRIHTDVGHQCVGAKVNDRLVPLDYHLQTGEVIKITTSKAKKGPSRDWLNPHSGYVKTANAREKIRQWFRQQERDDNILHGREMLDKELKRLGLDGVSYDDVLKHYPKYSKLDDFLAAIAYGGVTTQSIATKLVQVTGTETIPPTEASTASPTPASGLKVMGVDNVLANLARCCRPVPGDEIIGYITRGRGVTVHRSGCHNIVSERERDRLIPVDWDGIKKQAYPVAVKVEAWDRVGLLRDITTVIADEKVNMSNLETKLHGDHTTTVNFTIEVNSIEQLSRLLARLETIRDVFEVRRDTGRAVAAG